MLYCTVPVAYGAQEGVAVGVGVSMVLCDSRVSCVCCLLMSIVFFEILYVNVSLRTCLRVSSRPMYIF